MIAPSRAQRRCLLATLLLLLSAAVFAQARQVPVPMLDSPVIDTTGTLDTATRARLEQRALALQQRKGSQLQVLMIPTTGDEPIEDYAIRAFEQFRLGRDKVDDGVLLVVAKDDRKVRIEVGYGLEGAIPDITAGRVIAEYMAPHFRQGDFGGGLLAATEQLEKLVDGEPLPEPLANVRSSRSNVFDSVLPALFAAFVVATVLRGFLRNSAAGVRGLVAAAGAGGIAWLLSSLLLVGGIGALIGLVLGVMAAPSGRFAHDRGWGGMPGGWGGPPSGGWGGGSGGWGGGGGFGGGGWSGGGGMSGGGGASGGW
ncbi:MAG: YgcG family protein [Pseudoxanthomonas suwonensis]|nr:YgcG family protein [Pseudoxanthomonas suwonensis]